MGRPRFCGPHTTRGNSVSPSVEKNASYINFNKIWAISSSRYSEIGPDGEFDVDITGPIRQYRLSDIGRYLLNPNTIEVNKKLIGCEVHFKLGGLKKIFTALRRLLPGFLKRRENDSLLAPEVMGYSSSGGMTFNPLRANAPGGSLTDDIILAVGGVTEKSVLSWTRFWAWKGPASHG